MGAYRKLKTTHGSMFAWAKLALQTELRKLTEGKNQEELEKSGCFQGEMMGKVCIGENERQEYSSYEQKDGEAPTQDSM